MYKMGGDVGSDNILCTFILMTLCDLPFIFSTIHAPRMPRSCSDIKLCSAIYQDDEYWLNPGGITGENRLKIYCHKMNSDSPEEYISFPDSKVNYAERYQYQLKPPARDCNGKSIVSLKKYGKTEFFKLKITLQNMSIVRDNYVFTQLTGNTSYPYGFAGDCFSANAANCTRKGSFNVNLTATGLRMADSVEWNITASGGIMQNYTKTKKTASSLCGGWCVDCEPNHIILEVDVAEVLPDTSARFIDLERCQDVRSLRFQRDGIGKKSTATTIHRYIGSTVIRCAEKCIAEAKCRSFNYDRSLKSCELKSSLRESIVQGSKSEEYYVDSFFSQ